MLKRQNSVHPTIQLPQLLSSVTSQGSISNFIAQTPKHECMMQNFKKSPNVPKGQQKQNISQASNNNMVPTMNKNLTNRQKSKLPYKMVESELPETCINHPEKESSFYVRSDEEEYIFYCEKCAILVACQGFKVEKILGVGEDKNMEPATRQSIKPNAIVSVRDTKTVKKGNSCFMLTKQHKEQELNTFLNTIQRLQSRIDNKFQSQQNCLTKIDQSYQTQSQKIKILFTSLHNILNKFQHIYLQQLTMQHEKLRQPIQIEIQGFNSDLSTLESMKEDICQAYDEIISHTTSDQFGTVMSAYKDDTSDIDNRILEFENNQKNENDILNLHNQLKFDINIPQILQEIQNQIEIATQSERRLSTRSTKRRMSICNSKIR